MNFSEFPLRFAGDLPTWSVILMAVLAVVCVLWLYQRETKKLASPYNFLLPSLRAAAVAMVVLVLAGPIWHHRQVVGTLGSVVFALDTSKSMSLVDSQGGDENENRLRRATRLLFGEEGRTAWVEEIAKTHLVEVVAFDSGRPRTIWSSNGETSGKSDDASRIDLSPDGADTDLSAPLNALLSSLDLGSASSLDDAEGNTLRRSAVVLMSDGRDTASAERLGRSSTVLAESLANAGTIVHTLGFGTEDEPADVGIADVVHPETVALDNRLAGEIIVGKFGRSREPITVRIESEGETVWQDTFTMNASGQRKVPFELDVQSIIETIRNRSPRGIKRSNEVLRLIAKVETNGGDYTAENNLAQFRVAASTRNRRLLMLDGSSRWETRYIKNLFQRDPAWQVDLLLSGPGTDSATLKRGPNRGEFPDSGPTMARYDAIWLGEVHPDQLSAQDLELIDAFVAAGGGLIVVDGRFRRLNQLAGKGLGDLLPIRFRTRQPVKPPASVVPTATGLQQPSLALIDRSEQLESFWKQLPLPRWAADVELAEGAESWADLIWENGRRAPWLATRMYGSGRVFYFASDQSWRWRYKVADR
ncbi:MAG: hypothetical protein AAF802_31845, partial [Planctomycetota bacterium]